MRKGGEIGEEGETYVAAVDGDDLILTIDANIQSIVEKYLKEACIDNVCTDGGNIVVMNPKNGDILAMATYPDYNLNEPYAAYTEELKGIWDTAEQAKNEKAYKQCGGIERLQILMSQGQLLKQLLHQQH